MMSPSSNSNGLGTLIVRCLNSNWAVSPMRAFALSGSLTPGICTSRRSSPTTWRIGSPSPDELSRRSMVRLKASIWSAVGGACGVITLESPDSLCKLA